MASKWKRAKLWVNNNLVAEVESTEGTFNANTERAHIQDGVDGASEGNVEIDVRVNIVKYVDQKAGAQAIEDAMFNQTPLTATYLIGSTAFSCDYRVGQGTFNSETKTGTSKASFTLMSASVPQVL